MVCLAEDCVVELPGKRDKRPLPDRRKGPGEESPGFTGQGCRITSGGGDSRDSATEMNRLTDTDVLRRIPLRGKGGRAV